MSTPLLTSWFGYSERRPICLVGCPRMETRFGFGTDREIWSATLHESQIPPQLSANAQDSYLCLFIGENFIAQSISTCARRPTLRPL